MTKAVSQALIDGAKRKIRPIFFFTNISKIIKNQNKRFWSLNGLKQFRCELINFPG